MATNERKILDQLNHTLARANLNLVTLTAARQEEARVKEAVLRGDFENAIYPVPECFHTAPFAELLAVLPLYRDRFESFNDWARNDVRFEFNNGFFSSPDAEILYAFVRSRRPARILEIGCGNSTKVVRQAIIDGGLNCHHTCIDPSPREDISALADSVTRVRVESLSPAQLAGDLKPGDILFIDTSHEVTPANDVAFIFGRLLPALSPGVFVHIHDVFLPYEYPMRWVMDLKLLWGEQYLLQSMLMSNDRWEVLWPGYYLQRTLSDFASYFPHLRDGHAQSFWMRNRC